MDVFFKKFIQAHFQAHLTVTMTGPQLISHLERAYWLFYDQYPQYHNITFVGFVYRIAPFVGLRKNDVYNEIKAYWKYTNHLPRSGGVLISSDSSGQKYVLLVRNYGGSKWFFPIGKNHNNELNHQTAQREIFEETGYLTEIDQTKNIVTKCNRDRAWLNLYIIENVPFEFDFKPQTTYEIEEIKWFDFDQLQKIIPRQIYYKILTKLQSSKR